MCLIRSSAVTTAWHGAKRLATLIAVSSWWWSMNMKTNLQSNQTESRIKHQTRMTLFTLNTIGGPCSSIFISVICSSFFWMHAVVPCWLVTLLTRCKKVVYDIPWVYHHIWCCTNGAKWCSYYILLFATSPWAVIRQWKQIHTQWWASTKALLKRQFSLIPTS